MTSVSVRMVGSSDEYASDLHIAIPQEEEMPRGAFGYTPKKIPRGFLSFEECERERRILISSVKHIGLEHIPPISKQLRAHWELFVTNLLLWEQIPIQKCMSAEDIAIRCLTEGPLFAEWLKKARFYSYVHAVCEGANDIPDEYIVEGYKGYDSLFRESELIHWREETHDVEYSFISLGNIRDEEKFRREAALLLDAHWKDFNFPSTIGTLDWIKPSRGYDPATGKSVPVRDEMRGLTSIGPGWLGKRTLIRPFPAGIRDTAQPDADTLAKIKLTGEIFSEICEHVPESGMSSKLDARFSRILRYPLFHHLDFKKAGLTFPRRFFVILGEEIEKRGIDAWFIRDLENIYLDIDDDTYRTNRGFCLGWVNEGLTLALIILLRVFRKEYGLNFDFIVYNDDVLIGDRDRDPTHYSELFRIAAKEFFCSNQIMLSEKKCYTSKSAQFLEEYYYQKEHYKLDMEKRTIATALFAKSLCSQYIWEAKMYCEAAYERWQNNDILRRCMSRGIEHDQSERTRPYKAGGWVTPIEYGLDASLDNERDLKYLVALQDSKLSTVAEKVVPFDEKKTAYAKHKKIYAANRIYPISEDIRSFLEEQRLDKLSDLVKTRIEMYEGRKKVFLVQLDKRADSLSSRFWEPP